MRNPLNNVDNKNCLCGINEVEEIPPPHTLRGVGVGMTKKEETFYFTTTPPKWGLNSN